VHDVVLFTPLDSIKPNLNHKMIALHFKVLFCQTV
jgi:hypothetical protein